MNRDDLSERSARDTWLRKQRQEVMERFAAHDARGKVVVCRQGVAPRATYGTKDAALNAAAELDSFLVEGDGRRYRVRGCGDHWHHELIQHIS